MGSDFLGIDPGLNGGLAVVSDNKIRYKLAMPTISVTTKKGNIKKGIDRGGIITFLQTLPEHTHAAIEEQQAFRSQNVTSTCTTCKNYGILLMGLFVAHTYITEVPSSIWQAHFGIVSVKKGEGETTKQQAANIAQALYPNTDFRKSENTHIPHDGIIDAVLIANYCQARFASYHQLIEPADSVLECKPGGKEPGTKLVREMF